MTSYSHLYDRLGDYPHDTKCAIVAAIWAECEGKPRDENLRYTTVDRLIKIYPSVFKGGKDPTPYLNNPEKLANLVYAPPKLGNIYHDDGWRFRGRGYLQLTGRNNYVAYAIYKGAVISDQWLDTIKSDIGVVEWYLFVHCKVKSNADLRTIVRAINPALLKIKSEWDKRVKLYNDVKEQLT